MQNLEKISSVTNIDTENLPEIENISKFIGKNFSDLLKKFIDDISKWWIMGAIFNILKGSKKETKILQNEVVSNMELKDVAIDVAKENSIPEKIFVNLINKENRKWDPTIVNKNSWAFWLAQMIPSTWKNYSDWLDKNNPKDQLTGWARFFSHIKDKNNCSWEEAVAFYNTWENFDRNSNSKVPNNYIKWNLKSIVWQNPKYKWKNASELYWKVTKKEYFDAAVKYYNA